MKRKRISDVNFFTVDANILAQNLLGCYLCRNINGNIIRYAITETEAYIASVDSACHAFKGKTMKNRALFERGGHAYIHICYGIHFMLNIVAGEEGYAEGVLVRSVESAKGPGNVTKKMFITKDLYMEDLSVSDNLWLEERDHVPLYKSTKRIGLGKCLDKDKNRLWRYVVE